MYIGQARSVNEKFRGKMALPAYPRLSCVADYLKPIGIHLMMAHLHNVFQRESNTCLFDVNNQPRKFLWQSRFLTRWSLFTCNRLGLHRHITLLTERVIKHKKPSWNAMLLFMCQPLGWKHWLRLTLRALNVTKSGSKTWPVAYQSTQSSVNIA